MARRPATRRGYVRAESEAAFQTAVLNLAAFCGWRTYHPPDNRPSGNTGRVQATRAGWPDVAFWRTDDAGRLVVADVSPPAFFLAELKAEKGRMRPEQIETIAELRACGVEVHVWRPSDWAAIEERLRR